MGQNRAVTLSTRCAGKSGKLIGIFGASWPAIRVGPAAKPRGLTWRDLAAVSILGGVGFTVSLLLAELAPVGDAAERAKAAVLPASAAASLPGALALVHRSRVHNSG